MLIYGSAANEQAANSLRECIPDLQSVQADEQNTPEDTFQAQICLAWLFWELSDPEEAAANLPQEFERTVRSLTTGEQSLSPWTQVCIVQGGYLKGAAEELSSGKEHALQTFKSTFSWAATPASSDISNPQLLFWSEQYLARASMLAYELFISKAPNYDEANLEFGLRSLRLWASHPDIKGSDPAVAADITPTNSSSKTSLWRAYYDLLSIVLQNDLQYPPMSDAPKRVQLSTEFRRIEATCENVLLRHSKFPKANVSNQEVELWVKQVIHNWEVFCSAEWCDDDFGEGGQGAISRNVLDILYRAATKTFHSTLILRELFHVHAALAEFDLALHALDTYIHLVKDAKERSEHSSHIREVEDPALFIYTLAEGLIMLCCFGSRREAEKVKRFTDLLDEALSERIQTNGHGPVQSSAQPGGTSIPTQWVSFAYRAIGIGLATWARWTPISESRAELQANAICALEKALVAEAEQEPNPATVFALAMLRAETRDLDGAIELVRTSLSSSNVEDDAEQADSRSIINYGERDIVPLWHLLALLLSSKEDFKTAANACDVVFEMVSTEKLLHKQSSVRPLRSPTGKEEASVGFAGDGQHSRFPDIETRERESMVELRMTQLALMDVMRGPEAALNYSDELISLFGRLFAGVGLVDIEGKVNSDRLTPPKSASGTVRTGRASIFGWKKNQRPPVDQAGLLHGDTGTAPGAASGLTDKEAAVIAPAPAIQVTNNDEKGSSPVQHRGRSRQGSLLRKENKLTQKIHRLEGSLTNTAPEKKLASNEQSDSARQALPPVYHNMKHTEEPAPAGHPHQPPIQDVRMPTARQSGPLNKALTRFPRIQEQKHSLSLLVKIWLFISDLYRKALLLEDAMEACNEASTHATRIEGLVAAQESSTRAFADEGWGGTKSPDEIWGDIYAERGYITQAQSKPYEAIKHFEEALMHYPDHPRATVGLATLLLDIHGQTLPAEESSSPPLPDISNISLHSPSCQQETNAPNGISANVEPTTTSPDDTPESLNRLAARDRAYGLLSTLTKLGTAWDNSEAWFALSRAYEQGGQIEKAKEVLWWCIDLENGRPVRHWWNVGSGGYVL
ncbi:filamentation protein (Rhf1), putative [Trichophyton benhamiae CBS 112371]|uniref:Filamentation protein (Rhf1), putative n=1 Tax=Arthroderma benhamiae (strain ATCC MYA-4681 / CBS 112371) TaxID=663331 RepID=D4ASC0_ARTBC|nr:filamentation protein (Rhf1), putative [Trichophyton benhamiae CBS 112371]EFE34184.1 filamentation protein (Rhf1), putative [Trichophyton benhamiae CBS 112371]